MKNRIYEFIKEEELIHVTTTLSELRRMKLWNDRFDLHNSMDNRLAEEIEMLIEKYED